jgi:molybdopterin molybdotransferase
VLPRGTLLGASRLAALAAAGIASVRSPRRPRVAIVTTGTELRRPGETLRPGEIYESNGLMLATLFAAAGADVERLDAVADDPAAHRDALARGLERDVVVTSGGVSVGPHDLVRGTLAELGVDEILWGVAMRPGKPFAFGVRGRTLAFGLPGNPVSSLVGALLFVRPALRALLGDPSPSPSFRDGVLAADVACHAEREDFVRARLVQRADGPVLEPLAGQESHMIVAASRADALVRIPRGAAVVTAGSVVRYLPLDR